MKNYTITVNGNVYDVVVEERCLVNQIVQCSCYIRHFVDLLLYSL